MFDKSKISYDVGSLGNTMSDNVDSLGNALPR